MDTPVASQVAPSEAQKEKQHTELRQNTPKPSPLHAGGLSLGHPNVFNLNPVQNHNYQLHLKLDNEKLRVYQMT